MTFKPQKPHIPPKSAEEFELLCWDLWMKIWDDPHAKRVGRNGQSQDGVDIVGRPRGTEEVIGVQCKCKEILTGQQIGKRELLAEVEKAKAFSPKLTSFILATTAQRHAPIQRVADELSQEHRKSGLFSVHIYAWQDIDERLIAHRPLLARQIYDDLEDDPLRRSVDELIKALQDRQVAAIGLSAAQGQSNSSEPNYADALRGSTSADSRHRLPETHWTNSIHLARARISVRQSLPTEEILEPVILSEKNPPGEIAAGCRVGTPLMFNVLHAISWLRRELAGWNYDKAKVLGGQLEKVLAPSGSVERLIMPGILALLARVRLNHAESCAEPPELRDAALLLERAERTLAGDAGGLAEIIALKASLENLENGADAGLSLLKGRTDPYAIRSRTAILLNQQKITEVLAVFEGLEPHEWWCDVAVKAYALNDQVEKAQSIVQWSAGAAGRSKYLQCVVRLAEGLLMRALAAHASNLSIQPQDITPEERSKLAVVTETLRPVLMTIEAAGRPTSGLDMAALQIAWQANHLLQRRETAVELLRWMDQWTPVPLAVGHGVVSGYIDASPDLPDRLSKDHPASLEAGVLAAGIECDSLGRCDDAFARAKSLLSLADTNDKKETLFKLFQTIWQNLEGPAVAECERLAGSLIVHHPRLRQIFEASIALRRGEADKAISLLDGQRDDTDSLWLQYRANALLQKQQFSEAVDFLLPVAKITDSTVLLHKTGDIAFQANRFEVAVWCYERLVETQSRNIAVRGNLAHIYAFVLHDLKKAAEQFRALRTIEPANSLHTFNLAICLAQVFRPDESLSLYDELCGLENPPVQAVLGRAQLHHSVGNPEKALASLQPFRSRYWHEPDFLLAYMSTAHAAGDDAAGHEALMALNKLREMGTVKPEVLRMVRPDEAKELFRESFKQTQDRDQHLHGEMLKGRMPWVWAEQVSNNPIYVGWRTRTQEMAWIGDEPINRARLCIYSTNGFHVREAVDGVRSLLALECPKAGTKVVADVSALISLHRLGLLEAAAEYFGEVMVPAGYLPTVLEDGRQMVLHQRSRQQSAEQIVKLVTAARIATLADNTSSASLAYVDEYAEATEHRYRLRDLIEPLQRAGLISDAMFADVSRLCAKPTAVDDLHPALEQFQPVMMDLSTLETVANARLLDAVSGFYRVCISPASHQELIHRLNAVAHQEETRQWHMDMWNRMRGNSRFKFVPHTVPEVMRGEDRDAKDFLPFLSCFIAQATKTPLLADDRVCQAFTLNERANEPYPAFGTDMLAAALMEAGKLEQGAAAALFSQLMAWRYRFIVPPPEVLKVLADQYRGSPPGQALQRAAEYVHDCMRDFGLFNGPENTALKESMAMRLYVTWLSTIAEFLVLVWADESFTSDCATLLTEWSCREFLPSCPSVVDGRTKVRLGDMTARLLLSTALINMAKRAGEPRMADAMTAMKNALRLSDDDYMRIVTGILHDTARTAPQP